MKCGKWEDVNSFRLHPLICLNLKWKKTTKNLKDYFTVKIAPGSSFLTSARFIDAAAEQTTSLKQQINSRWVFCGSVSGADMDRYREVPDVVLDPEPKLQGEGLLGFIYRNRGAKLLPS